MNDEEIKKIIDNKIEENNNSIKRGMFSTKPIDFNTLIFKYANYIDLEMNPYYKLVDKIKNKYNIDNINVDYHKVSYDRHVDYNDSFHKLRFIIDDKEKDIDINIKNKKFQDNNTDDYLYELGKCYVQCIENCRSFYLDNGIGLSIYKRNSLDDYEVAVNSNFFLNANVERDFSKRENIDIVYDFIKKETTCLNIRSPYIGEPGNFYSYVLEDNSAVMSIINNLEVDTKKIPDFINNTSSYIKQRELQKSLEEEKKKERVERENRELLDKYHDSRMKTEKAISVQNNLRDKLDRKEKIPITQEELFEAKVDNENNKYYDVKDKYKNKLDDYDLSLIVWDNVLCSGLDFSNTNILSINFDVQKIYKKDISHAKFGDNASYIFGPNTNFNGVNYEGADFGDFPVMLNLNDLDNKKYLFKQMLKKALDNDGDPKDIMRELIDGAFDLGVLEQEDILKDDNSKIL